MKRFKLTRIQLFRKLTGLFLILALVGASPGTIELFKASAQTPFTQEKINLEAEPVSVTDADKNVQQVAESAELEEEELEEIKKREMSRAEEIAWNIGKALMPTLAVMTFSAAVVCPLAWVVVGAVAVGAVSAGMMTLGYELRKNSFRSQEEKKEMDKIWRDVTIAAAVNGAMAPFSMATAGIAQAVGPVTMKTIVKTAAKAGAVSFLGSTVSNATKGAVTNLWYDHYYDYDEREKYLKARIETLAKLENRTPDQEALLVSLLEEFDTITKEKYTWDNFRQDEKKALVSAGISGILGGAAAKIGAESDWAKIVSSKLFGSTDKSAMISNAVLSNPFAFATGSAMAAVDKKELLNQVAFNRKLQLKYEKGSPAWQYYEQKIADLEEVYKTTSLLQAGNSAMINNAANQAAIVGTSLAKTRLWDLPSAKRKQIQQRYEEQDPEFQKVNEIRAKIEQKRLEQPVLGDYESRSEYSEALRQYATEMKGLRTEYKSAMVVASNAQKKPANRAIRNEISAQVSKEIDFARRTELAKALGTDSYLEFKYKELKDKPENTNLTEQELRSQAEIAVRQEFAANAKANAERLAYLEKKIKRTDLELEGNIEKGPDGKRYVVIRDAEGNYVRKRPYQGGEGAYWFDRLTKSSPAELKQAELDRMVKEAYNSASMVRPTTIRNEYVNMKVNDLRAQGYSDAYIDKQMSGIVSAANERLTANYGSWQNIAKAEILAVGLEKARYDDGASPSVRKILEFVQSQLSAKTISIFQNQLKQTVQTVVPDEAATVGTGVEKMLTRDEEILEEASQKAIRDYYSRRR